MKNALGAGGVPSRARASHRARVTMACHVRCPPYPPSNVPFAFRALRPCVCVHPRLAQVPAMAVTSCGPPSHPITFDSPSEFCALASALFRVLREFQQWLSRFADGEHFFPFRALRPIWLLALVSVHVPVACDAMINHRGTRQ